VKKKLEKRKKLKDEKKQQIDRFTKLLHSGVVSSNSGRWDMAEHQIQRHRMPEVPSVAIDHHSSDHDGDCLSWFNRGLLPEHVTDGPIPACHDLHNAGVPRIHHLRLRCDG